MNKVLSKIGGVGQSLFLLGLTTTVLVKVNFILIVLVVLGFILMALAYANAVRVELKKLRQKDIPNRYTIAMLHGIKEAATDLSLATLLASLSHVLKPFVGLAMDSASIQLVAVLMPVSVILGLIALYAYAMYLSYTYENED
tara:strand:- start:3475 stop:3900 length:426 start_codon:yes stop_codon:yes gene_type:complete